MDPELSTSVDAAINIISSGRWSAVTTRVDRLAANPAVDGVRHAGLLKSFGSHVSSEFALLKSAHSKDQQGDPRLLAWRARNLLELSVWSIYCSKSRANAWRFYEDAGRDLMDVFSAFERVGVATNQQPDFFDAFVGAKHDLSKRAASKGIESLEGQYKRVNQASKECGIEDLFSFNYKLLSKFAHPTAMIVLAPADKGRNSLQRDYFFSQGCLFFTGAFEFLEVWLEREVGETARAGGVARTREDGLSGIAARNPTPWGFVKSRSRVLASSRGVKWRQSPQTQIFASRVSRSTDADRLSITLDGRLVISRMCGPAGAGVYRFRRSHPQNPARFPEPDFAPAGEQKGTSGSIF